MATSTTIHAPSSSYRVTGQDQGNITFAQWVVVVVLVVLAEIITVERVS